MEDEEYDKQYTIEKTHAWFRAKRLLISQWLPPSTADRRLLDIGCGTGANLEQLRTNGWVVGVDNSLQALTYCQMRGLSVVVCAKVEQLPFKDACVSEVTALDILEHIEREQLALKEITRILSTDGHFLLTVPAFTWLWSGHDDTLHHVRRYSHRQLIKVLEQYFHILRSSYWCFLLSPVLVFRVIRDKIRSRRNYSYVAPLNPALNKIASSLFAIERSLMRVVDLPFGISLIALAKKR